MVYLVNCLIIVLVVVLHYEALHHLGKWIPKLKIKPRLKISLGVLGALMAHVMEVWIYAFAYFKLIQFEDWGSLQGNLQCTFMDCVYFLFTTYTTVGFGDISPVGDLRFIVAIDSLVGLVLIALTASFLYFQIESQWQEEKSN
ncbi:MAG: hypothetical protein ACI9PZ_000020 [Parvicella sp.]|jgi:hypothetical protein